MSDKPSAGTAQFSIHSEGVRHTVVVNGEDVSDKITAATVMLGKGNVALLRLQLAPSTDPKSITGEGVVELASEDDTDAVVAFLENIDPAQLEKAVMADDGGMGGDSPPVVMLRVLKEWASGLG